MSVSFEEHLRASNLAYVSDRFECQYDRIWVNKGDRVRGELVVLPAPQGWESTQSILESHRCNGWQVEYATAYELAAFAADPAGWNGQDIVMAPGSHYSGGRPCLRVRRGSFNDQRELYIEPRLSWRIFVLVVILP